MRQTRIAKMEEFPMPALTQAQSLEVARGLYERAGLSDVFSAVMPALAVVLGQCKGNIGAVIRQTENLMADPKNASGGMPGPGGEPGGERRKHGAGIFITIVCVVIVLACMVPLFMGTGFLSSIFGSKDGAQTEEVVQQGAQQSSAAQGGARPLWRSALQGRAQGQGGDAAMPQAAPAALPMPAPRPTRFALRSLPSATSRSTIAPPRGLPTSPRRMTARCFRTWARASRPRPLIRLQGIP